VTTLLVGCPGSVGWPCRVNSRRARTTRTAPTIMRAAPPGMMAGVRNPRGSERGTASCRAMAARKGMPKTTSKVCHQRLCATSVDIRIVILTHAFRLAFEAKPPNGSRFSRAAPLDQECTRADTSMQIAIGRASPPFPRSKRSRPVSRHSAFQLGHTTLIGRTCRCRPWSAPAGQAAVICFRHFVR